MAIGLIDCSYPSLCANRRIPWLARLLVRESAMAMDVLVVMVLVVGLVFRVRACRSFHEVPSTSPHLLWPDKIRGLMGTRSLVEELPNRVSN